MTPQRVLGIIMAGGKGERLLPLTEVRSKPAVPFGGKYRIIDFVLSNFVNSDACQTVSSPSFPRKCAHATAGMKALPTRSTRTSI